MKKWMVKIHVILTLSTKELVVLALECLAVPFFLLLYNLLGLVIGLPRVIRLPSIIIASILIILLFVLFKLNKLYIDWDSINASDEGDNTKKNKSSAPRIPAVTALPNGDSEICKVESSQFDFSSMIHETWKKGEPKEIVAHINNMESLKLDQLM